ncbi:MAG: ATP-binding protein, partial [Deltaproteobacteria bacterium]|nr:ATP-binding protein [Deltaproteobacteria bacterium]
MRSFHPLTVPVWVTSLAALGICYVLLGWGLQQQVRQEALNALAFRAGRAVALLEADWPEDLTLPTPEACGAALRLAQSFSVNTTTRLVVLNPSKHSLCVWPESLAGVEPPGGAEVGHALKGQTFQAVHESAESAGPFAVVALPVFKTRNVVAVVHGTTFPLQATPWPPGVHWVFGGTALGVSLVLLTLGWGLQRRLELSRKSIWQTLIEYPGVTEPWAGLRGGADGLNGLSQALQHSALSRRAREGELTQRLREREAVLTSMTEGVLAVDANSKVLDLNLAAAAMFEARADSARGRNLIEVVRNPALHRFMEEILASEAPVERELTLGARFLQANGARLRDPLGRNLGALAVFNDVTRLRRLENIRREFVANVSHELKTPITSIKGFAETLLEGAAEDPVERKRFLEIIAKHSERLADIIEDLLSLSRIEQEEQAGLPTREPVALIEVLDSAIQMLSAKAAERKIQIVAECSQELRAPLNRPLAEQAVVNLIDNAVKYGPAESVVRVTAMRVGGEVVIQVNDQGPGIAAEHLGRLFERFFRVDKSRDRRQGGIGLG